MHVHSTFQIKTVFNNVLFSTEVHNPLPAHLLARSHIYHFEFLPCISVCHSFDQFSGEWPILRIYSQYLCFTLYHWIGQCHSFGQFFMAHMIYMYIIYVGEWVWGVEGSRLEAWMKSHKSEVAISITFICTPTNQETVSVLEKTQANKTFRTWKQM